MTSRGRDDMLSTGNSSLSSPRRIAVTTGIFNCWQIVTAVRIDTLWIMPCCATLLDILNCGIAVGTMGELPFKMRDGPGSRSDPVLLGIIGVRCITGSRILPRVNEVGSPSINVM